MFNELLLVALYGIALSFIGSIPFGIINMTVAETTVRKGFAAGAWTGFGASLVEYVQVWVSLKLIDLLVANSLLEGIFNILALIVFFLLAAYYLRVVRREARPRGPKVGNLPRLPDFFRGVLVSSLNVMVFPYWVFYGAYLSSNGWMELNNLDISIFAVGSMTGTFLVLLIYAGLGMLLIRHASSLRRYFNWFLFLLFLGLGLYQAWRVFHF